MSTQLTNWKYLAVDRYSSYLQLSIIGRRIRARTLHGAYMRSEDPMTPAEIAENYDLPIEAVQEAIAYCQSDPPEIRADFERTERLFEKLARTNPDYRPGGRLHPLPSKDSPAPGNE